MDGKSWPGDPLNHPHQRIQRPGIQGLPATRDALLAQEASYILLCNRYAIGLDTEKVDGSYNADFFLQPASYSVRTRRFLGCSAPQLGISVVVPLVPPVPLHLTMTVFASESSFDISAYRASIISSWEYLPFLGNQSIARIQYKRWRPPPNSHSCHGKRGSIRMTLQVLPVRNSKGSVRQSCLSPAV